MDNLPGQDPIPLDEYDSLMLSTKEQLDKYWSATKPLLEKCIKQAMHGELTAEDIYNLVTTGKAYIFIVKSDKTIMPSVRLAWVVEIVKYPRLSAMNIIIMTGQDMCPFMDRFWKRFCGWAYMNGIRAIEGHVSPAMERLLSRYKFKPVYTHVRLDLLEE